MKRPKNLYNPDFFVFLKHVFTILNFCNSKNYKSLYSSVQHKTKLLYHLHVIRFLLGLQFFVAICKFSSFSDYVVITANTANMVSPTMVAKNAIVTISARVIYSATLPASVLVLKMLKAKNATGVKRTNMTDEEDA